MKIDQIQPVLYILLDKHLFYIDTNSQVSRYSGIFTKTGKKITKNSQNCQGAAPISNNGMKLNFTVVVGHTEIIFHLKNQASISMFTIFFRFFKNNCTHFHCFLAW